jgi:hypothetical protein
MFSMSETSVDTLEEELVACERIVGRLRARQLELLRGLDAAQVQQVDGARSLEDWVAARCDVSHESARSLTRAMKILTGVPEVWEALMVGDVSFDRAVATGRLAAAGGDADLLVASGGFDIAGVGRLAGRHRRVTRRDERQVAAGRHLAMQPSLDRSSGRAWGELPGFDFATLEKAVYQRSDELPSFPGGESRGARLADALVSIAEDSLDGEPGMGGPRVPAVTVSTTLWQRTPGARQAPRSPPVRGSGRPPSRCSFAPPGSTSSGSATAVVRSL